jgi:hypothetical protein
MRVYVAFVAQWALTFLPAIIGGWEPRLYVAPLVTRLFLEAAGALNNDSSFGLLIRIPWAMAVFVSMALAVAS